MPIHCPQCGLKHDPARLKEFSFLECSCGFKLNLSLIETAEDFLRYCEGDEEEKKAFEIQEDAQKICQMILNDDFSEVDIELAKEKLRHKAAGYFPDKIQTFRMIYEARFKRFWNQFRA